MTIAAMERYATQQARMLGLAGAMHHNLAATTDLDGLDKLLDALTRVLFHNEKITVMTARAAALQAERQREADEAEANKPAPPEPAPPPEGPPLPAYEQGLRDEAEAAAAAESAAREAEAGTAAPDSPTLVVKQKPPVSKPGRKRGYVYKGPK